MGLICALSTVSNGSLLWVIVRQRSNSASANGSSFTRLLFMLTASDFVHSTSMAVSIFFVWRKATVDIHFCYHIIAVFVIALNYSIASMLMLSVDRLLSVVVPIWWVGRSGLHSCVIVICIFRHRSRNLDVYTFLVSLVPLVFSVGLYVYGYQYIMAAPGK